MTQISIRVRGELVRKGLQDLHKEIPQIGRQQIRVVMERVKRIMEAYPPERPMQQYQRTGRLFYSWGIDRLGNTGYTLKNDAQRRGKYYAQWVVGDAYGNKQNRKYHKGRWPLLRDTVEEEVEKRLPPAVAREIVMVARRKGFEARSL